MGKKFMGLGGTDHFWDRAKAWILNQITSAVAAKIAEVVANAPEDLDTLKEIADWIKNHANDAAAMNTQITENKNNIAALSDDLADKQDFRIFNSLEEFNEKNQFATFNITIDNVTGPYGKIASGQTMEEICASQNAEKQLVYMYVDKATPTLIPYTSDKYPTITIK